MKRFSKKFALMLVLAMIVGMFSGVMTASAANAPFTSKGFSFATSDGALKNGITLRVAGKSEATAKQWYTVYKDGVKVNGSAEYTVVYTTDTDGDTMLALGTGKYNGLVRAKSVGMDASTRLTATILDADGNYVTAISTAIYVRESAASVDITTAVDEALAVGATLDLDATFANAAGQSTAIENRKTYVTDYFKWTSSDETIATVDQSGVVTAVAEGTATITVSTYVKADCSGTATNSDSVDVVVDNGILEIASAEATGLKVVTVTFNKAVEDTSLAVFKIVKGAAIYNATAVWNDDKTVATVTNLVDFVAADYTVKVTGLTDTALTASFTTTAETYTSVAISSTTLDDTTAAAQVAFKVLNQYGEDMEILANSADVTVSGYNVTQGAAITVNKVAFAYFTVDTAATAAQFVAGDQIRIIVTYKDITTTATLTVVNPSANAAFNFGAIALASTDANSRLNASDATATIGYTLVDQYGATKTLAVTAANADTVADIETISGVRFVSSAPTVVDVDDFTVDSNGVLSFVPGVAGTAVITAVINASGSVSTITIVVAADEAPASVVVTAPTAVVAANDATFDLALTVTDQFGSALASSTVNGFTATSSAPAVVASSTIANGVLTINPATAGTATITIYNLDATPVAIGTITITVEANAVATNLVSTSVASIYEVGATETFTDDNLVVLDQYGREFTGGAIAVASSAATVTAAGAGITAASAGTSILTITYAGTLTLTKTVTVIAVGAVTSYTIDSIGTMYGGATGDASYNKTVTISGVLNGQAVKLATTTPSLVTSSNTLVVSVSGNTLDAIAAGTVTITAWYGAKSCTATVTSTTDAPVPTTITWSASTISDELNLTTIVTVKDQYGVTITPTLFFVDVDSTSKFSTAGLTVDVAANTAVVVTVVCPNGLTSTATITITND